MHGEILENPVTGEALRVLESTPTVFRVQYSLRPHGEIAGEHFHPGKEQQITVLSGNATPGSGLGLSLVRHVARAHGGRVHVQAREGGGAAVVLELPVAANGENKG